MTSPLGSEDVISVPVKEVVYKGTKAVVATLVTAVGVLTLFGTSIADGVLTWEEGGKLIGAVVTAVATIGAVYRVPNEVKGVKRTQ